MTPHNEDNINSNNVGPFISDMTPPPPPPSSSMHQQSSIHIQEDRENHESSNGYTANCCYNTLKINPPFDSAMALTVLVLLTALFFMGFFSIYIRRFADENNVDPTRFRRRRRSSALAAAAEATAGYLAKGKGVDPAVVGSLPVYVYSGGDVEQGISTFAGKGSGSDDVECAICLSEFEETEYVKVIPYCGHVFHVECIDTWLASHVTCPLCRTAEFFPEVDERESVAGEKERRLGRSEVQGGVEDGRDGETDTCRIEVGVRRTSSCSWYGERVCLQRSLSY